MQQRRCLELNTSDINTIVSVIDTIISASTLAELRYGSRYKPFAVSMSASHGGRVCCYGELSVNEPRYSDVQWVWPGTLSHTYFDFCSFNLSPSLRQGLYTSNYQVTSLLHLINFLFTPALSR